ncbi:MAG: lipocalin family protein [Bacteroidales bacterium]
MKTRAFFLLLSIISIPCFSQAPDIKGAWTLTEVDYISDDGNQKMSEQVLKTTGSYTEISFQDDHHFRQVTNMSGSGKTETYEGTWNLDAGKLTFEFSLEGKPVTIAWDFEMSGELIKLTRSNPDKTITITNFYRKK